MFNVDLKTLILMIAVEMLLASFLLAFLHMQHKQVPGTRNWALGMVFSAIGFIMVVFRGTIPLFWSIVIANGLIFASVAFQLLATRQYLGLKPRYALIFIPTITLWLPYFSLYDQPDALLTRIHLANIIVAYCMGFTSYLLFKHNAGSAYIISGVAFLLMAFMTAIRSITFYTDLYLIEQLLDNNNLTTKIYYFWIAIYIPLLTAGVAMLTSDWLRRNLEQALGKELEMSKEQSRFWAMISHEFRTPLATIQNSAILIADMLARDSHNKSKEVKDEGERINRAAQRMGKIVDKSLAFNWIDLSNNQINKTQNNLAEIIEDLSFEYSVKMSITSHENYNFACDRYLLGVALSSILDNAIKYGKNKDKCEIKLTKNGHQIIIQILDDGSGVSEKEAALIFDKFYRAKSTLKTPGSGMGLFIAKKLIELHGGEISLKQNSKTCMEVTFNQ